MVMVERSGSAVSGGGEEKRCLFGGGEKVSF